MDVQCGWVKRVLTEVEQVRCQVGFLLGANVGLVVVESLELYSLSCVDTER